jgi:hypothetical protein
LPFSPLVVVLPVSEISKYSIFFEVGSWDISPPALPTYVVSDPEIHPDERATSVGRCRKPSVCKGGDSPIRSRAMGKEVTWFAPE